METERQQMDDETMPNDEIGPKDAGAAPHPSAPVSMSDRRGQAAGHRSLRDPLLPADRTREYRDRWGVVQARFVDEPQRSVERADALVVEVVHDLQTAFAAERSALEAQWRRGDDVQTEDLRVAFQRYRTFFDRLLSA